MWLERISSGTTRRVGILGVASGAGGRDPGAKDGARALHAGGLAQALASAGVNARWAQTLTPAARDGDDPMRAIGRLAPRLARATFDLIAAGATPLVIGGDHSCAIGTWSGVYAAVRDRGPLGLVWIDAHLDSHTPQTSHTGLVYGMPLAALLGYGDALFTDCMVPGPKLLPEHVCIVGARSYEPEERALLDRIGVRVIEMDEVRRRGTYAAIGEALAIARRAGGGYGISLDLDAIDPGDAPGVGTPAAYGIPAAELIAALDQARVDAQLAALEIVEYNPLRDRAGVTMRHAIGMATAVLGATAAGADRARAAA